MMYKLILILLLSFGTNAISAKRISCKSFKDQAAAQKHYDSRKKNWKSLDRDKDGEPCECLKGGSKEGKSVCVRWRKKYKK